MEKYNNQLHLKFYINKKKYLIIKIKLTMI